MSVVKRLIALANIVKTSGSSEPEVYHFTSPHNALSILTEKRIALTPVIGSQADVWANKGKFYYFSTSRSPTGRYAKVSSESDFANVQLVFGRDKLKANSKIVPVDYWGRGFDGQRETEDRLVSDKPFMNLSALKAVHVALPLKNKHSEAVRFNQQLMIVLKLMQEAIRGKYEVFVYEDRKAFLMLNRKKALPRDQWKAWFKSAKMQTTEKPWSSSPSKLKSKYIAFCVYVLQSDKWEEIPEYLRRYVMYLNDIEPQVAADVHNYRTKANHPIAKQARELIVVMKKMKLKTLKEMTNLVAEKSHQLQSEYYRQKDR